MDSLLVNELAGHYRSRFLRFTPKIFAAFGIGRHSVTLEMGGPGISCIPYEFSVSEGRLLAVLSDGEMAHFLARKETPSKLILSRKGKESEGPENFHIPVHLERFQRPTEASHYCLIHLHFIRLPHEITELLVAHFFQMDQADAFVSNLLDVPFELVDVVAVFKSLYFSVAGNARAAERMKVLSYTVKRIQLFGEYSGTPPHVGEKLEFQPFQGDADCMVTGTCSALKTFPELPGFLWLELDQELTLEVVKKLMKFAKTAKTRYLKTEPKKKDQPDS